MDDDPDSLDMLQMILESSLGVRTAVADGGQEALRQAAALKPSLIILDLMMPAIDGFDLVRQLRATAEFETTPVIAMSGWSVGSSTKAIEAGCDDFISKPFDVNLLVRRTRELLQGADDGA